MKKNRLGLSFVALICLFLVACGSEQSGDTPTANSSVTTASTVVTVASNVSDGSNTTVNNATATSVALPTLAPATTQNNAATVATTQSDSTTTYTTAPTTQNTTTAATIKTTTSTTTKKATTTSPVTTTKPSTTAASDTTTTASSDSTTVASNTGSLKEVLRGKAGKKLIAITLDAGSTDVAYQKELEALDSHHVKATFFMTGQWVRSYPQDAIAIANDGMELGNHTFDHPDLTKLSDAKVKQEIQSAEETIKSVTGVDPKPLFRFPFGSYNGHLMNIINSMGYRSIYWTYDSLDSVGDPKTADQLYKIVTSISDTKLDGAIILMHLGNSTSGDALSRILTNLQGRGFHQVTISELIKESGLQ